MTFRHFWTKTFPILKNKYILVTVVFLIIILFFSQNNLLDRFDNLKELNQLKKDREYFLEAIDDAEKKMNELMTNKDDLEKFAREQYLMKKPDEDIFIIVKEE
ncbi:MAG: septum formation initiator family protein [Bacteroidetes bacterium]|nr:septum formation initiator family protein [Bacteroidota bacterium]